MELKEFISETIKQVAEGLVEANKHIKESIGGDGIEDGFKKVSFDVTVTTTEEDKSSAGGKITIAQVLNIGAKGENLSKATNYNRIQFETFVHVKTN